MLTLTHVDALRGTQLHMYRYNGYMLHGPLNVTTTHVTTLTR